MCGTLVKKGAVAMYKRIVLKISGEALAGEQEGVAFFEPVVDELVRQVKAVLEKGTQVSLVIGGGNFWRGRSEIGRAHV